MNLLFGKNIDNFPRAIHLFTQTPVAVLGSIQEGLASLSVRN